jgi:hypothetical protein
MYKQRLDVSKLDFIVFWRWLMVTAPVESLLCTLSVLREGMTRHILARADLKSPLSNY